MQALTGTKTSILTNEKELKSSKPSTFTASFSKAEKAFSLFPGKVMFIGQFKNTTTVNVAVSDHEIVRYMNLTDVQVKQGAQITKGRYLGSVINNKTLDVEYCSQWQGDSVRPVRIENRTYFKQNPLDILEGMYVPQLTKDMMWGFNFSDDVIELTEDQKKELGVPLESE